MTQPEIDRLLGLMRDMANEPADCDHDTYRSILTKLETACEPNTTKLRHAAMDNPTATDLPKTEGANGVPPPATGSAPWWAAAINAVQNASFDCGECPDGDTALYEKLWRHSVYVEKRLADRIEWMDTMLRAVHAATDLETARARAIKGLGEPNTTVSEPGKKTHE